ncbi:MULTISPECIES: DUF2493 domain-containing protein [unclassified Sphingomonas]|uniref:DUF2493 domain-containing protein n=1 Tax=unclassified Sphingomonas TaxID=196159 RepID=UPI002863D692|nr:MULTISPECIES: DUF2493 domain-containing protein [unclassified Sphingomonas]MDR6116539.1 hypothetical protein [Sphingomonas sp. SORGH_AS_0789]MDR6149784.1 hypothetical protein [Sphingomonas sp. SORGH_AS_0742]
MTDTASSGSVRSFADLPNLYKQLTATPEFERAFGDPIPLSIIEPGEEPGEHDMPDPLAVQADCGAIIATLFDLFVDTRIEPLAAEVAWGFVNSFHFTAQKLERREQALADELGDLARRPDLSEVYNREMEEKQLLCQSIAEHREAMEVCRDYAAEMYRVQTGWPWSPARGSRASKASTATQVAIQDYLRQRELDQRDRYLPRGPLVVASGHAQWHDWQPIWDRLDTIRARIPTMTVVTTAQRKGFDAIVAAWCASRNVPLLAYGLVGGGRRAPFLRNRKLAELNPVEAVLGEGSGIQANLYQTLRQADVPIHAFRKADQAPIERVGRPGGPALRRAA